MMLRKAQRDLIHRLEREYSTRGTFTWCPLCDFRALLEVAKELLWEAEAVREAQGAAEDRYKAAMELHLDKGKRDLVRCLEYRISGQRGRIRELEEMNAKLRAGDTSGIAAAHKAEKDAHKRTREGFNSLVRQRDEALAELETWKTELAAQEQNKSWWSRVFG